MDAGRATCDDDLLLVEADHEFARTDFGVGEGAGKGAPVEEQLAAKIHLTVKSD